MRGDLVDLTFPAIESLGDETQTLSTRGRVAQKGSIVMAWESRMCSNVRIENYPRPSGRPETMSTP